MIRNITEVFNVDPGCFYRLNIGLKTNKGYKTTSIKIVDINNKLVFPPVMLPDVIFTIDRSRTAYTDIKELDKLSDFEIFFKNTYGRRIKIITVDADLYHLRLHKINKNVFDSDVNLWRMRRMLDFKYVNYYISNVYKDFSKSFVTRLMAQHTLLKNVNYFDGFIKDLKVQTPDKINWCKDDGHIKVLYLMDMSQQYESLGYTVRGQALLKYLKRRDVHVLACTKFGYPYDRHKSYYEHKNVVDDYTLDGVMYTKLLDGNGPKKHHGSMDLIDYIQTYIWRVINLASKLGVDVIHGATDYLNGLAAVYAAKYLGIKSVYEVRGFWEESAIAYKPEVYMSDTYQLRHNMECLVLERADKVITLNEALQLEIGRRVGKDADIVSNGVDLELVKPDESVRQKLRESLKIPKDTVVLGYLGSLLVYEGIDYSIDVVVKLVKEGIKVKFVFAGTGLVKDSLLKQIKDSKLESSFIYLGVLTHTESVRYTNVIDVIMYPRRGLDVCRSTLSSKIFEAMAMERCVVCSNLEPYHELIQDRSNGVFCIADDPDNLLIIVRELIIDKELRDNISKKARESIIDKYSWEKSADKLLDVYETVLGRRIEVI